METINKLRKVKNNTQKQRKRGIPSPRTGPSSTPRPMSKPRNTLEEVEEETMGVDQDNAPKLDEAQGSRPNPHTKIIPPN